jgi:hypothetical protein
MTIPFPPRIDQLLSVVDSEPTVGPQVRDLIARTLAEAASNPTAYGRAEIQAIAARTFQLWDSVPGMVHQTNLIINHLAEADLELRKAGWFLLCLPTETPTPQQAADPTWFPYKNREIWGLIRSHPTVKLLPGTITNLRLMAQGKRTLVFRSSLPLPPEPLRSIVAAHPIDELPDLCEKLDLAPPRLIPWIIQALETARDHLIVVGRRLLLMQSFRLYVPLGLPTFPDLAAHCGLAHQSALTIINLYRSHYPFAELIDASLTEGRPA